MRRMSDRKNGERTGSGRRARDRILAGELALSASLRSRHDLENQILFLADDLRESALAIGGIEGFLLEAQQALEKPDLSVADLRRLLECHAIVGRIELLEDALASLRRSITLVEGAIERPRPARQQTGA